MLKSSLHTLWTSGIHALLALSFTAVLARALGPTAKGEYDLLMTTAVLLGSLLGLSVPVGITYVVAQGGVNLKRLARLAALFSIILGLATYGLLHLISGGAVIRLLLPAGIARTGIMLVAVYVLFLTLGNTFRAILTGQLRFIPVNNVDQIRQGASLLFLVIGIWWFVPRTGWSKTEIAIAVTIAVVALSAALYAGLLRFPRGQDSTPGVVSRIMRYSLTCHAANTVQFLNYRLDAFLVNALSGAAALGKYQLAVSMTQVLALLPGSIASVLAPTIASGTLTEVRDRERTAQAARLVLVLSLAEGTALGLAGYLLVPLIFGPAFRESLPALFLLLPGVAVFGLCTVLAAHFSGCGRPQLNLVVSLAGVAVTIPLDLLLIPRYGIIGAAIASSLSYSTSSVLSLLFYRHLSGQSVRDIIVPRRSDWKLLMTALQRLLARAREKSA